MGKSPNGKTVKTTGFRLGRALLLVAGMPSGHIIDRLVIEPFIKQLADTTQGRVEIQHFPAEQPGRSRDLPMMTQAGVTDIGFIAAAYHLILPSHM